MTSTTFFIIFIPILSILLLFINLLLAPHNPYQEKDSVFECGFHSFLGQNRTQFSVSFFIFALLFLLFDLEILLVYPYSVSGYNNDIYGLAIMMIFFILLTLGFIFELGKNALTIDSKQTFSNSNTNAPYWDIFIKSTLFGRRSNKGSSRIPSWLKVFPSKRNFSQTTKKQDMWGAGDFAVYLLANTSLLHGSVVLGTLVGISPIIAWVGYTYYVLANIEAAIAAVEGVITHIHSAIDVYKVTMDRPGFTFEEVEFFYNVMLDYLRLVNELVDKLVSIRDDNPLRINLFNILPRLNLALDYLVDIREELERVLARDEFLLFGDHNE